MPELTPSSSNIALKLTRPDNKPTGILGRFKVTVGNFAHRLWETARTMDFSAHDIQLLELENPQLLLERSVIMPDFIDKLSKEDASGIINNLIEGIKSNDEAAVRASVQMLAKLSNHITEEEYPTIVKNLLLPLQSITYSMADNESDREKQTLKANEAIGHIHTFIQDLAVIPQDFMKALFSEAFSYNTIQPKHYEAMGEVLKKVIEKSPQAIKAIFTSQVVDGQEHVNLLDTLFYEGFKGTHSIQQVCLNALKNTLNPYLKSVYLGNLFTLEFYSGSSVEIQAIAGTDTSKAGSTIPGLSQVFVLDALKEILSPTTNLHFKKGPYAALGNAINDHLKALQKQGESGAWSNSYAIYSCIRNNQPCFFNITIPCPSHAISVSVSQDMLILQNDGGAFDLEKGILGNGRFAGKVIFNIKDHKNIFTPAFIRGLMCAAGDGTGDADLFQTCMDTLYTLPIQGVVSKRGQIRGNCGFTHTKSGIIEDACLYETYALLPQLMSKMDASELKDNLATFASDKATNTEPWHRRHYNDVESNEQTINIKGHIVPVLDSLIETQIARRIYRDYSLYLRVKAIQDFANNPNVVDFLESMLPEDEKAFSKQIAHCFILKSCGELIRIIDKRTIDQDADNSENGWVQAGFNTLEFPNEKAQSQSIIQDFLLNHLDKNTPLGLFAKQILQDCIRGNLNYKDIISAAPSSSHSHHLLSL